jgi:hypothetical protein
MRSWHGSRGAVHRGCAQATPLEHPGSRKAAVLFPVAYTSLPEGGQGLKVKTNVKAGVVTNLSVAVTQNVTVNQSTTMTVSAGPDM